MLHDVSSMLVADRHARQAHVRQSCLTTVHVQGASPDKGPQPSLLLATGAVPPLDADTSQALQDPSSRWVQALHGAKTPILAPVRPCCRLLLEQETASSRLPG